MAKKEFKEYVKLITLACDYDGERGKNNHIRDLYVSDIKKLLETDEMPVKWVSVVKYDNVVSNGVGCDHGYYNRQCNIFTDWTRDELCSYFGEDNTYYYENLDCRCYTENYYSDNNEDELIINVFSRSIH